MRVRAGQLQHSAFRGLQLGMILLDQPSQLRGTLRRQLLTRLEQTFTLKEHTDIYAVRRYAAPRNRQARKVPGRRCNKSGLFPWEPAAPSGSNAQALPIVWGNP
jgi:hypothetical protein